MGWLDRITNAGERALLRVAPVVAMRRAQARYVASTLRAHQQVRDGLLRRYDGAGTGRRFDGWHSSGGGPNEQIGASLPRLRARCRDLTRNNRWAGKALRVLGAWTVGTGIRPQAISEDVDRDSDLLRRAMEVWSEWAETPACDARGRHNFYGLQRAVDREVKDAGECLVRRRFRRPEDGLPVPIQLEVLEPDHLDLDKSGRLPNGGWIVQGVQFTPLGAREGYWLHPDHPGEDPTLSSGGISRPSQFVRAQDVRHVFREDRAGQVRGVPWGAAAVLVLRDWEELADADLVRRKIAASYAGFVHDADPALGIEEVTGQKPGHASEELRPGDSIEPGTFEWLPPGKDIKFSQPPEMQGFKEQSTVTLQGVAAAFGVTYEALTGDLSGTNFTSGRMGWLEMFADVGTFQQLELIPTLCTPVWEWAMEAAVDVGRLKRAPRAIWTPPSRPYLDPRREVLAQIASIRAGLSSLPEEIRARGRTPDHVLEESRRYQERLVAAGLVLDTDLSGAARGSVGASGGGGDGQRRLEALAQELASEIAGARGLEDAESDLAALILEIGKAAGGQSFGAGERAPS